MAKKVQRIPDCCPHRAWPEPLTWKQAEAKGWRFVGFDRNGAKFQCPETTRMRNERSAGK